MAPSYLNLCLRVLASHKTNFESAATRVPICEVQFLSDPCVFLPRKGAYRDTSHHHLSTHNKQQAGIKSIAQKKGEKSYDSYK